jgi:hypothetical protein
MPPTIGPPDELEIPLGEDFLAPLFEARPAFIEHIEQQRELLAEVAPQARQRLLQSLPELSRTTELLQSQARRGLSREEVREARERIRVNQISRGFEGGTSPAFQEAAQLTGLSQQRQLEAAGQLTDIGTGLLGPTGLTPPDTDITALGSLFAGQRQLQALVEAGRAQSQFSIDLFEQLFGGGPGSANAPTTNIVVGGGGAINTSVGSNPNQRFDPSGNPLDSPFSTGTPQTGGQFNTGATEGVVVDRGSLVQGAGGLAQMSPEALRKFLEQNAQNLTTSGQNQLRQINTSTPSGTPLEGGGTIF